ncbi:hypothetical protein CDAR_417751 [Caerostris darwini]|uniref:Uncharacterized protein n=1 Tax=Caerostris darwini TaxID=1538125 RepID=A0AAV4PW10_9ARAC|nr:hypothetical protein CDAR_417751 [Caerostris darwini]
MKYQVPQGVVPQQSMPKHSYQTNGLNASKRAQKVSSNYKGQRQQSLLQGNCLSFKDSGFHGKEGKDSSTPKFMKERRGWGWKPNIQQFPLPFHEKSRLSSQNHQRSSRALMGRRKFGATFKVMACVLCEERDSRSKIWPGTCQRFACWHWTPFILFCGSR